MEIAPAGGSLGETMQVQLYDFEPTSTVSEVQIAGSPPC